MEEYFKERKRLVEGFAKSKLMQRKMLEIIDTIQEEAEEFIIFDDDYIMGEERVRFVRDCIKELVQEFGYLL